MAVFSKVVNGCCSLPPFLDCLAPIPSTSSFSDGHKLVSAIKFIGTKMTGMRPSGLALKSPAVPFLGHSQVCKMGAR